MSRARDRAARTAVWLRLIDIAEDTHDLIVLTQAKPSPDALARIGTQAEAMRTLSAALQLLEDNHGST